MGPPTFTVVMPAYNTEPTIEAAIRSVLAQTRTDLELIVVDDGSTDRTAPVVEELAGRDQRVHLLRQENTGAAAARNTAMLAGRGTYVSFIDSDDLWLPTYLEAMADALSRAPDAGFAYTDAWTLDSASGRIGRTTAMEWSNPPAVPPADAHELALKLLERNFVYTAVTLPHTVLQQVGPFDTSLRAGIDYDMWLRIAIAGYRAVRPSGLLAVYNLHRAGSISSDRTLHAASLVSIYDRVADQPNVGAEVRDVARRRAAVMRAELVALQGARGLDAAWRARVRPALVRLKAATVGRDAWLEDPPPEVAAAFPELVSALRGNP